MEAYSGYGESQYGSEGGYDNSGDMYLRRRQGRIRRQAIRLPDQPGAVRQVRHRMPTPRTRHSRTCLHSSSTR